MNNPLLSFGKGLPEYSSIKPEHIQPAIQDLLAKAQNAVDIALSPNTSITWEDLIEPLEDATEALGRSWSVVSHLNGVADTPELREAFGKMLPEVTAFWTSLGQNLDLYKKYKQLSQSESFNDLNSGQKKVIHNSLRDFRLGGAELSDDQKKRFAKIQEEQAKLSKAFSDHVLDATDHYVHVIKDEKDLSGLPEDAIAAAKETAETKGHQGWAFTLHFPSYFPVMQLSENRALRKSLYQAYVTRASELGQDFGNGLPEWDNTQNMLEQLIFRDEEAKMLGFANYAELSISTKMARSVSEVDEFLETFAQRAKNHAYQDWIDLEAFAKSSLGIHKIEPWDIAFASEKLKQARYSFSENELKQYFPLPKVLDGLFNIIQTLFGVLIEKDNLPKWHADVQSFKVSNKEGKIIANFYIDPYARPGKRGGAWMDDARGRRVFSNGYIQTPVAYLVCNFPPPVTINGVVKQPTITHDDVITMFHECGHGLHHMLTQVGSLGVSGINGVEWDAVELPSQFMENFCWEWEVLQKMTANVETGEPLPKTLYDKIMAAKNFQNGLGTLRQLVFSLTDWKLHSTFDAKNSKASDILKLSKKINDEIHVIPQAEISRWPNTFSHIFSGGYSAGYYSYKWAEVLSADAYSAFEEAANNNGSVLDRSTGERYLKEILEVGGSRPAADSFKAFRGREPKIDALLRHGALA